VVRRTPSTQARRRSVLTTVAGAVAVTAALAYVLADRRDEFSTALTAAPMWILVVATALQLLALVSRTEAWRICVLAAGGTVGRRCLFRAASTGYVGSQLNSQIGTAVRIGALRRAAPDECPRVPALIAAEVPILTVEAVLAALASFTLVGPLDVGPSQVVQLVEAGGRGLVAEGAVWAAMVVGPEPAVKGCGAFSA
jgi:uncharacterized membrane protein YbhN (UPF0104 family)